MKRTIRPTMSTAKNSAEFSLFLCLRILASAAFVFALAAALVVAFAMILDMMEKRQRTEKKDV